MGGLLCYLVRPVRWRTDELRAPDFLDVMGPGGSGQRHSGCPTFLEDTAPSCMGTWWDWVLLLPPLAATEGVVVPIYTGGN